MKHLRICFLLIILLPGLLMSQENSDIDKKAYSKDQPVPKAIVQSTRIF
jgi:hypothetical protein